MDSSLLHLLIPLIGVIVSFFKSFKFIHEGEQGIKLRFGRALRNRDGSPRVIQPGFVLLIPFVESLKRHHVRQQTVRFENQVILTKDSLTFSVNAVVIFRVVEIYKALFEILDLDHAIENVGMGILRDEISHRNHDDLNDPERISEELLKKISERAKEWGVEFIQFKMTDCAPTPETAPLVVVKTGAIMRAEALDEAAKKLNTTVEQLSPEVAAVLVGVPLTTSISGRHERTTHKRSSDAPEEDGEHPKSLLETIASV